MQRGMPLIRFVTKVATQSATAIVATLVGGYFLAAMNLRAPDPHSVAEPGASDGRTLTREYVKSLREGGREAAVEVRPIAATPAPPNETVVVKAVAVTAPPLARKESRLRTEASATVAPAAPPLPAPIVLGSAPVAAVPAEDPQLVPPASPEPRGRTTVFSVVSTMIGNAANAAGDGINFVIDLPGRAIGRGQQTIRTVPKDAPPAAVAVPQPPLRYAGS